MHHDDYCLDTTSKMILDCEITSVELKGSGLLIEIHDHCYITVTTHTAFSLEFIGLDNLYIPHEGGWVIQHP